MALGREDVSVARTNGGADVFGLAGFLRDDDLISHDGSWGESIRQRQTEHKVNNAASQAAF
jgi:hypothetical protein